MIKNPDPVFSVGNTTPYTYAGSSLSLSRPALAGISRDVLEKGLPFRFSAPGSSMSPFIRDSDVITLAPYQAGCCETGAVVAFIRPDTGQLTVHRIIAVSGTGCRTRGDNSSHEDGEIPQDCIIGQVVRVERADKDVRFGLGPERVVIALLSRWRVLPYCTSAAAAVFSMIRRLT